AAGPASTYGWWVQSPSKERSKANNWRSSIACALAAGAEQTAKPNDFAAAKRFSFRNEPLFRVGRSARSFESDAVVPPARSGFRNDGLAPDPAWVCVPKKSSELTR